VRESVKFIGSEKPIRAPSEAPQGCQLCVCRRPNKVPESLLRIPASIGLFFANALKVWQGMRVGRRLNNSKHRTSRIHFSGDPDAKNFLVQTQKLLRKSFLTQDGIARRFNPDFSAWLKTLPVCLRRPRSIFYRSGLACERSETNFVHKQNNVDGFRKSVRCSVCKAQESTGASQRREERKKHECYKAKANVGNH